MLRKNFGSQNPWITEAQLHEALGGSRAAISRLIRILERKGLIIVKHDNNLKLIALTSEGEREAEELLRKLGFDVKEVSMLDYNEVLSKYRERYVLKAPQVQALADYLRELELKPEFEIPSLFHSKNIRQGLMWIYNQYKQELFLDSFGLGTDLEYTAEELKKRKAIELKFLSIKDSKLTLLGYISRYILPHVIRTHRLFSTAYPVLFIGKPIPLAVLKEAFIDTSWYWPKMPEHKPLEEYIKELEEFQIIKRVGQTIMPTAALRGGVDAIKILSKKLEPTLIYGAYARLSTSFGLLLYHDISRTLLTRDEILSPKDDNLLLTQIKEMIGEDRYKEVIEKVYKLFTEGGLVVEIGKDRYVIPHRVMRYNSIVVDILKSDNTLLKATLIALTRAGIMPTVDEITRKLNELLRQHGMKVSVDVYTVLTLLNMLKSYGICQQVAHGRWITSLHIRFESLNLADVEGLSEDYVRNIIPAVAAQLNEVISRWGRSDELITLLESLARGTSVDTKGLSHWYKYVEFIAMLKSTKMIILEDDKLVPVNRKALEVLYYLVKPEYHIDEALRIVAQVIEKLKSGSKDARNSVMMQIKDEITNNYFKSIERYFSNFRKNKKK